MCRALVSAHRLKNAKRDGLKNEVLICSALFSAHGLKNEVYSCVARLIRFID